MISAIFHFRIAAYSINTRSANREYMKNVSILSPGALRSLQLRAPIKVLKQLLNQHKKRQRISQSCILINIFPGVFLVSAFFPTDNIPWCWRFGRQKYEGKDEKRMLISKLFIYSFRTCSNEIKFLAILTLHAFHKKKKSKTRRQIWSSLPKKANPRTMLNYFTFKYLHPEKMNEKPFRLTQTSIFNVRFDSWRVLYEINLWKKVLQTCVSRLSELFMWR